MDEVETDISNALYARLGNHEFSSNYPIAFAGIKFDIPATTWLSAKNNFSRTDQITFGDSGRNRYIGFLRVDVNYPNGDGELPALRIAAEIVSLYKRGTSFLADSRWVRVTQPPQITGPLETSEWIRVPVTIRWQSDNPNVT